MEKAVAVVALTLPFILTLLVALGLLFVTRAAAFVRLGFYLGPWSSFGLGPGP
jgi:hypothetical protein